MRLLVRLEGNLVRSVLDCPGVICMTDHGGRQRFVIDTSWEPSRETLDTMRAMQDAGVDRGVAPDVNVHEEPDLELPAHQHEVDLDDLVEACEGHEELRALVMLAMQGVLTSAQTYVPRGAFEMVIAAAEHGRDVRELVQTRLIAEGAIPPDAE